ncbi:SPATS1 [Bugula neritina]|uniref:SPATS1 n=1 Tax=Bugula neritina TaxID=10212 RepID=A0A7J7J7M9_BUGNE|nr:SPATS1 [Bugula neritina]
MCVAMKHFYCFRLVSFRVGRSRCCTNFVEVFLLVKNEQDDKYRNLAMAEVMAATKHIRVPSPCMKTKEPTNPPAVATYRKCVGVANEIFPDQNWPKKKYFDCHNKESMNEWDIMKDCDKGKTCTWDGVHRHIMTSFDYNSVTHRPRVLNVQRNGIPEASRGDKSYQTPEYSSNFHKQGSTRPVPNFGGRAHNPCDTYIPLVKPTGQRKTFQERERERQDEENAAIVSQLEEWRPATPLVWRPNKNLARVDYSSIHTSHQ